MSTRATPAWRIVSGFCCLFVELLSASRSTAAARSSSATVSRSPRAPPHIAFWVLSGEPHGTVVTSAPPPLITAAGRRPKESRPVASSDEPLSAECAITACCSSTVECSTSPTYTDVESASLVVQGWQPYAVSLHLTLRRCSLRVTRVPISSEFASDWLVSVGSHDTQSSGCFVALACALWVQYVSESIGASADSAAGCSVARTLPASMSNFV